MTPCTTLPQQNFLLEGALPSTLPFILIVEDDDNIRDLLVTLLTEEHYHVLSARSGEQALQLLARHQQRPQVLLLDYMLPGMNGISLYDQVSARFGWRGIPTVVMSAALPEQEVTQRSLIGVPKPFDIDALLIVIEKNVHPATSTSSILHKTLV